MKLIPSLLTQKTDVQIIREYCNLFQSVSWHWIALALFLLLANMAFQKFYSARFPKTARQIDSFAFTANIGFLFFLLLVVVMGGP